MARRSVPGECFLKYSCCTGQLAHGRKSCRACLDFVKTFPSTTKTAIFSRTKNKQLKREAFEAYGGIRCACCGEEEFDFLTLDHVNNDGSKHQTTAGRRGVRYHQLKQQGWPQDPALQVLCFNCNCGKKINGGVCPHQSKRLERAVVVTWADAEDAPKTWADDEEAAEFSQAPCHVNSIGFIIAKTKEYLTLARDFVSSDGTYGGVTKVPLGMIIAIRPLNKVSESTIPPLKPIKMEELQPLVQHKD